jgi:hypothetical protein
MHIFKSIRMQHTALSSEQIVSAAAAEGEAAVVRESIAADTGA